MSNTCLSEDLLVEILLKLPLKYILRCKSVSKSWAALILSKEFIRLHLNQSIMDPKCYRLLVGTTKPVDCYNVYAGDCDSPQNFTATVKAFYNPLPRYGRLGGPKLVGSCNGLVCLQYYKYVLVLCNPWTKKHWRLPPNRIVSKLCWGRTSVHYWFGYDNVNDDYNVVRLFDSEGSINASDLTYYSLRSNSWRRLPCPVPRLSNYTGVGVIVNSFFNCFLPQEKSIMAINLRSIEECQFMPLPGDPLMDARRIRLGVLNGCLSVMIPDCPNFLIWLMKDYGIKDSWTKLVVEIPNYMDYYTMQPVEYSESKEHLILFRSERGLLWYDRENKSYEAVNFGTPSTASIAACCCISSLVEPYGGGNQGTKRNRAVCRSSKILSKRRT